MQDQRNAQVNKNFDIDINRWPVFVAGRLSERVHRWRKLTSDLRILNDVRGYKLEMCEIPDQKFPNREIRFSEKEREFLAIEIDKLKEKKVIQEVDYAVGQYVSNVFLREKRDKGKYRMILNLKKLNKHVEYKHFKMDTLMSALSLVTPNCFFTSLDFTDAYYSVSVAKEDRKFLRFTVNGKLYEFTCVPNGLSTGPRLFTKLLKVPLAYLRKEYGITITGYLDDTLLIGDSEEQSIEAVKIAAELLQDLGFKISIEKSVVVPSRRIEFLGFVIDSELMEVSMIPEKAVKIVSILKSFLTETEISIRRSCKIIGILVATMPCNPWAPLKTKKFEKLKLNSLKKANYNYDGILTVSQEVKQDIVWWIDNLVSIKAPIIREKPHDTIFTDASLQGWGCYYPAQDRKFGGHWTLDESELHINVLELKAVYLSLMSIMSERRDVHLRIMTDNTTTMICITKQGSIQSDSCDRITRQIWDFALERNLWLSTAHCPGILNIDADNASRVFKNDTEWALDNDCFTDICVIFGMPFIDLFASRIRSWRSMFHGIQIQIACQLIVLL